LTWKIQYASKHSSINEKINNLYEIEVRTLIFKSNDTRQSKLSRRYVDGKIISIFTLNFEDNIKSKMNSAFCALYLMILLIKTSR